MTDEVFHDSITIRIGREFSKTWPLTDSDTGLGWDPTGGGAVCEVRTRDGDLIVRFHTTGEVTDGLITLTSVAAGANATLNLDDTKTALLSPVSNAKFELVVIDASGDPWTCVVGTAHVIPEVTNV